MSNVKYVEFLEKVIIDTKERKLRWQYLDGNEELYLGMNWTKTRTKFTTFAKAEEYEVVDFDIENSFYAKKDNTFIVLISRNNNPASLFVVPYTYKKVLKFVKF